MKSHEIRRKYLEYFKQHGHAARPSASLVPDDPTVLFTVAGMVQFKPYFLGTTPKPFTRAVTSQKCVRTNDIENVGFTPRHHTFFEMLGNFSFGDYFKSDAIRWAWDFLVNIIGLDKEKLWVTIHREDDEAFEIWRKEVGVPEKRIVRMGEATNFWTMGETGPCGPCSEILYDTGQKPGKPEAGPDEDEDRYLEIWNLVFTQYDRQADGSLIPLPQKNIDTGMGLERISAVSQGVATNFDIDLFQPLIQAIAKVTMTRYGKDGKSDSSIRVIADHVRSAAFLIADGILPGNEGRGYVLRRILRRAARHGKLLGVSEPFLHLLVPDVIAMMGEAYPEIIARGDQIISNIKAEEERFQHTLDSGLAILNDVIAEMKSANKTVIPGQKTFQLYDTYGFPIDMTREIAREHKLTLDEPGFEKAMDEQRRRARQAWAGSGERDISAVIRSLHATMAATKFTGYSQTKTEANVLAIIQQDKSTEHAQQGDEVVLVLDQSPFYAEAGGQVSDQGEIVAAGMRAEVRSVLKSPEGGIYLHYCQVKLGGIALHQSVMAIVRNSERSATTRNHTATHLLHAALRQVLGKHVEQAGSQVRPDGFRFDFSHFQAISRRELDHLEEIVNGVILENQTVNTEELPVEQAKSRGAMALFGEKYGDWVRMVQVGTFSTELCGGLHVRATGEIGMLRIISDASVASGIRRIEGVTGEAAFRDAKRQQLLLQDIAEVLRIQESEIPNRVERLMVRLKELEKEKEKLQIKQAQVSLDDLLEKVETVKGISVLCCELPEYNPAALRSLADNLKQKLGSGVVLLATAASDGKTSLLASGTKDIVERKVNFGEVAKEAGKLLGGSGGGRPDFGQAGGKDPAKIAEALQVAKNHVANMLQ